ncbi:MAG: thioredoxin family protein, partial [Ferruginibacter sp.]
MKCLFMCVVLMNPFLVAKGMDYPTLPIGSVAPGFNLKGTDLKMYSLDTFAKAEILVIIFTCNHCPAAQAYEDRIKQLVKDYPAGQVQVVAIMPDDPASIRLDELGFTEYGDSFEEMRMRARDKHFNFPYLYDGKTSATSKKYGPLATPHVFIFDKNRRLQYTGRIDNAEHPVKTPRNHDARNAIDALLAGKQVPVAVTKTFGCSIKWDDNGALVKSGLAEWANEKVTIKKIDDKGVQKLLKNEGDKLLLV